MRTCSKKLNSLLLLPLVAAFGLTACGDDGGGSSVDTVDTADTADESATSGDPTGDGPTGGTPTTGDDSDTNEATGDESSSGGAAMAACDVYCNNVLTNCTDANAVYNDIMDGPSAMEQCMNVCGAMPEGEEGDMAGDTAWCRAYHSGDPAIMDAATHCSHTGASSNMGVCGDDPCESYCDQVMDHCADDNAAYADRDQCIASCAAMPPDGDWNATSGNSVQCRTYHASFPAANMPEVHCAHAGSGGAEVCGTLCEAYCSQAMANCSDLYADEATCMTACGEFPTDGEPGATAGDSVQCRTYHASFPAAGMPEAHCGHAGPDGDGVCVDAN